MTHRRIPRLFRLAALLVGVGMLAGWMEIAIPDVHDGHGAQPETGTYLSHGHAPSSPAAPDHAPQSPHTCHCVHAHAQAMPATAAAPLRPSIKHLDFSSTERILHSVAPQPHFRPPVA